jgi:predicted HicB family RNase H-like nuclease
MAKKRFDSENNPALSYLSGMSAEQLAQETEQAEKALSDAGHSVFNGLADAGGTQPPEPEEVRAIIEQIQEKAKDLSASDRAALSRLYEIGKEAQRREAQPKEKKSKRLNLLIRPSIFEELKKIADAEGASVNDLINSIIEDFIATERGQRGLNWYRENRGG